jgi:integrase
MSSFEYFHHSGASEGEIEEWLGHADSKMVEHYRDLRSEDAQRKMEQIEFLSIEDDTDTSSDVA